MIKTSLIRLQVALNEISDKKAYDESQTYPNTYVNTKAFRIKFLRSELYNEQAAAVRIVNFLEVMRDYFGLEVLFRPPRLSDLGKEELDLLKGGGAQLLPCRDRSGRRIITVIGGHGLGYEVYSRVRALTVGSKLSIEMSTKLWTYQLSLG